MAVEWRNGERAATDAHPFTLSVMYWWRASPGGSREPLDPLITDYMSACTAALDERDPDWSSRISRMRDYCVCGEEYAIEACAVCTHCTITLGPCCSATRTTAQWDNGNHVCPRCHEGEIVG